jgi:hypothetical protein
VIARPQAIAGLAGSPIQQDLLLLNQLLQIGARVHRQLLRQIAVKTCADFCGRDEKLGHELRLRLGDFAK